MTTSLTSRAVSAWLSLEPPLTRAIHGSLALLSPGRRRPRLYWSAACADSALMAQQLARLDVEVDVVPVPMGAPDVDPEPALRASHVPRDCALLARFYDLEFPEDWTLPEPEVIARADRAVVARPDLATCARVSAALWRGEDVDGMLADVEVSRAVHARNAAAQRRAGHYLPGTVRLRGEWFQGPMRMDLVAERLGLPATAALPPRPAPRLPSVDAGTPLELWFSFRSPYSYLALARLARRPLHRPVVFRPVLPMVMRGLAVPTAKKLYLVRDAAQEARRHQIPFGRIADPVGPGATRCLAVCAAVSTDDDTARALAFAIEASRGIWSEGIDVATDAGLITLAGRAGIGADEVRRGLGDLEAGDALAARNRDRLTEAGVWGVPSFRLGEVTTWGQDRLPLLRGV